MLQIVWGEVGSLEKSSSLVLHLPTFKMFKASRDSEDSISRGEEGSSQFPNRTPGDVRPPSCLERGKNFC